MPIGLRPSWDLGVCRDQKAGSVIMAWGLDATAQLAPGQTVTAPVCTIIDANTGADLSSTLLSGAPSIGPNAAGTAAMVVTQAITNAVAGATYRLTVLYTPSPPSPSGEQLPLVLTFSIANE
jgi:hypothetical protein